MPAYSIQMDIKITTLANFKVQKLGTLADLVLHPIKGDQYVVIVVAFAESFCCLVFAAFFRLSKSLLCLYIIKCWLKDRLH